MIYILKHFWRELSLVFMAIALWFTLLSRHQEHKMRVENAIARDAANKGYQETGINYINVNGQLVHTQKTLDLTKENLRTALEDNARLKNIVSKFNVKPKDVESVTEVGLTFMPEKIHVDTVKIPCKEKSNGFKLERGDEDDWEEEKEFKRERKDEYGDITAFWYKYKDEYNDISALVIDTPRFELRDKIYAIETRTRPKAWFWKLQWSRWQSNFEITNANKLIKIDSVIFIKKQR